MTLMLALKEKIDWMLSYHQIVARRHKCQWNHSDHACLNLSIKNYSNNAINTQDNFENFNVHKFNFKNTAYKSDYTKMSVNNIEINSKNFCYDTTKGEISKLELF